MLEDKLTRLFRVHMEYEYSYVLPDSQKNLLVESGFALHEDPEVQLDAVVDLVDWCAHDRETYQVVSIFARSWAYDLAADRDQRFFGKWNNRLAVDEFFMSERVEDPHAKHRFTEESAAHAMIAQVNRTDSPILHMILGTHYAHQEKWDVAHAHLSRANQNLAFNPSTLDLLTRAKNETANAIPHYTNFRAARSAAFECLKGGEYNQAYRLFSRVTELEGETPDNESCKGECLLRMHDYLGAVTHLERAQSWGKSDYQMLNMLGEALCETQEELRGLTLIEESYNQVRSKLTSDNWLKAQEIVLIRIRERIDECGREEKLRFNTLLEQFQDLASSRHYALTQDIGYFAN